MRLLKEITLTPELKRRVEAIIALKTYLSDPTPLGRGVEIHEAIELPIYDKTPKIGWKEKYPPGHKEALEAEISYYRSLVPELRDYKDTDIDGVVIKRLYEKYGEYLYGNRLSKPIPFKAKNQVEWEIYSLIVNKLEKFSKW